MADLNQGTSASFNEMLKQYLPHKLLSDEIIKRDYFLQRVAKDQNWKGGQLQVPFVGANASSVAIGALPTATDISEDVFVRGTVDNYKELWGSMVFNQKDLDEHKSLEASFLSILPDRIDVFAQTMKESLSSALLSGANIDVCGAEHASSADGVLNVSRPEMFQIGQKIFVSTGSGAINNLGASDKSGYVVAIDLNGGTITVAASRGGSATGNDTAGCETRNIYPEGAVDGSGNEVSTDIFTSLPSQLLSSTNGGSATCFGQTKTLYPHLQAYNTSGQALDGSMLAADVANDHLLKIFDTQTTVRRLGRGNPSEAVMSYKNLAVCMKELEGNRQYQADVSKASRYGWTEIQVVGVKGALKLVGVPEMLDDKIFILDFDSMKLHSNGFVERREAPDGKQFYETRAIAGYSYILDHRFYGDLVVNKPSNNAVIHSISF